MDFSNILDDAKFVAAWIQNNITFVAIYIILSKIQEHSLLNSFDQFTIVQKTFFYVFMFLLNNIILGDKLNFVSDYLVAKVS